MIVAINCWSNSNLMMILVHVVMIASPWMKVRWRIHVILQFLVLIQTSLGSICFPAPALETSFNLISSPAVSFTRLIVGYVARELIAIVLRSIASSTLWPFTPLVITRGVRFAASLSWYGLTAFKHRSWVHICLAVATSKGRALRVIRVWHVHTSVSILYIKLFQMLLSQLEVTICRTGVLLGLGCAASQVIIGVSLCHKVLECALCFLRLIVIHVIVITRAWRLVLNLMHWYFFSWSSRFRMTSISFL